MMTNPPTRRRPFFAAAPLIIPFTMLAQSTGLVLLPENKAETPSPSSGVARDFIWDGARPGEQNLDRLPDTLEEGFGTYLAARSTPLTHDSLANLSSRLRNAAATTTESAAAWAAASRVYLLARSPLSFATPPMARFGEGPFRAPIPSLFPL